MPERETKRPAPSEAANAWAMTLVEPLLPDALRFEIDEQMSHTCRRHPSWAAAFYGGLLSTLVATLPESDPWRNLSGRIANLTVGTAPPEEDGAVNNTGPRAGESFGTWRDGTDVSPLVFDDVTKDVALVALSHPLTPHAAALLAFAGQGWETCISAARAVYRAAVPPDEATPEKVVYPDKWKNGVAGMAVYGAATTAVKWAAWRRRSYGITDDPFLVESTYRWTWRADRILLREQWNASEIATEISAESIRDPEPTHSDDEF